MYNASRMDSKELKEGKAEAANEEVVTGLDDSVTAEDFINLKCVVDSVSIPLLSSSSSARLTLIDAE